MPRFSPFDEIVTLGGEKFLLAQDGHIEAFPSVMSALAAFDWFVPDCDEMSEFFPFGTDQA